MRARGRDWAELALLPGRARLEVPRPGAGRRGRRAGTARPRPGRRAVRAAGREGGAAPPRGPPARRPGRTSSGSCASEWRTGPRSGFAAPRLSRCFRLPRRRRRPGRSRRWPRRSRPGRWTTGAWRCPTEAFTLELAELVTAVDRARIDRVAREEARGRRGPPRREPRRHVPGRLRRAPVPHASARFTRTLLDCTAGCSLGGGGAGPLGRGGGGARSVRLPRRRGVRRGAPPGAAEARGPLASILLAAQRSPDAGLRASARAVGPLAGLPIDPSRFRTEVLRRPDLGAFAFLGLVADRSLSPRDWQGLFLELFFGARSSSRDPSACTLYAGVEARRLGEGRGDRYCNLFSFVHFATLDLGDDEDPSFVSRERLSLLAEFARSGSAPPELRLDLKLGRAMRGTAAERRSSRSSASGSWRPSFAGSFSRGSRRAPRASPRSSSGSCRRAGSLRRNGASGSTPSRASTPRRATAWRPRRGARGSVPLDLDDGDAGAFARALDPDRVRGSEALRSALRRARGLPAASLEAATALARAGDPGSAEAARDGPPRDLPGVLDAGRARGALRAARRGGARRPRPSRRGDPPLRRLAPRGALRAGREHAPRSWPALASPPRSPEAALPSRFFRRSSPTGSTRSRISSRRSRNGAATGRASGPASPWRPGSPVRPRPTPDGPRGARSSRPPPPTCRAALASLLGIEPPERGRRAVRMTHARPRVSASSSSAAASAASRSSARSRRAPVDVDPRRPAQLPPLPAAPLPGGDRRPLPGEHRRARSGRS